jgi:hypothetical protein
MAAKKAGTGAKSGAALWGKIIVEACNSYSPEITACQGRELSRAALNCGDDLVCDVLEAAYVSPPVLNPLLDFRISGVANNRISSRRAAITPPYKSKSGKNVVR